MIRKLLASLLAAAPVVGHADELSLVDGSTLSGEVITMTSDDTLILESPIALDPLEIRAEMVRKVTFGTSRGQTAVHDARLHLTNGDVLPCDVITIGEEQLNVSTVFAGELQIDRSAVSQIELGMKPRKLLMDGPGDEDSWSLDDNWSLSNKVLTSKRSGYARTSLDSLTPAFSIGFELVWKGRPHMRLDFGSSGSSGEQADKNRYTVQFGHTGFELKRRLSEEGGERSITLGWIDRKPSDYRDERVQIEVRTDRNTGIIWIYLDGELEGKFLDPSDSIPMGNRISFYSARNDTQMIRNLEVREWDSTGDRHRSEDRGDHTNDVVIDNDGQRFNGSLIRTNEAGGEQKILFKIRHHEQPLEIPLKLTSTLFLALEDNSKGRSPLKLQLIGNGMLSAINCDLGDETIKLQHPLIGEMQINRDAALAFIQRERKEEDQ